MALKEIIEHFEGKTATYEGGTGYHTSFRETLAELFSLGMLNGMFYQTQEEVLSGAMETFQKALKEEPEFAAKCAVYGAERNGLKLVPTVFLVFLSTLEDKSLFYKTFPRIIRNMTLLHDFMTLCRKTTIRKGLGRAVKRAVNDRFRRLLNEYSASRNKRVAREIAKVTRPGFADEDFQRYMRYVAKDELCFERARELKRILEKLRRNEVDDDTLDTITKYAFQLEELKHALNAGIPRDRGDSAESGENGEMPPEDKQRLYHHLYKGLRYAALALNLTALERVFATETKRVMKHSKARGKFWQKEVVSAAVPEETACMVADKITRAEDYRASRILPFTLINAHRAVKTPAFKEAVEKILLECAHEAFRIPKNIDLLIGVDTSGSMSLKITDSLSALDAASFLGALIICSHEKTRVCAVADYCEQVAFKTDNLFAMAAETAGTNVGNGTRLEKIMEKYRGEKYLLLLTDSVAADNLEKKWLAARKPPDARLIVWQLQAYQIKLSNHRSVIYFAGYSDRLLELLKRIIEQDAAQIKEIEAIAL
ncbi:MAG: hypothetical protein LBD24_03050 [Spirochaetaceae bacterium]|jgi:60 kDa SS-A/Ro ribonucleoprotein|nr:hypothetical protein [Spirochaetaceae bacterium]